MNWNDIKRSFRLQFPPEDPADAGATLGSRPFEELPNRLPIVTITVLLISGVFFYFTHISPPSEGPLSPDPGYTLGFRDDFHIIMRDWWGIFTNNFFHGSFLHIIMNSMMLISLGSVMEKGLGSFKTLLIYLAIGGVALSWQLLANNTPLLLYSEAELIPKTMGRENGVITHYYGDPPFGGALGLSGIVFGVIGLMFGAWKRWTCFLCVFNPRLLKFVAFWQILCFLITWTYAFHQQMSIANTAHIAGFLFGFMIGKWMCHGIKDAKLWYGLSLGMLLVACGSIIFFSFHFGAIYEPVMGIYDELDIFKAPPSLPF